MILQTLKNYHYLVNGGWCSWAIWGDCSEICGDGIKTRTRVCECPPKKGVGSLCLGDGLQNSICNEATCLGNWCLKKNSDNHLYKL